MPVIYQQNKQNKILNQRIVLLSWNVLYISNNWQWHRKRPLALIFLTMLHFWVLWTFIALKQGLLNWTNFGCDIHDLITSNLITVHGFHPPSQSEQYFFEKVGKALAMHSCYDKILLTGNFNAEMYDH